MGMTNRLRSSGASLALGVIPHLLTGCGGTSIVEPGFNPKNAAAQAMDLYDANHDGAIDTAELADAASLRAVLPKADADGDGRLTQAELATRFGTYRAGELLVTTFPCSVTLDGQPLEGADVRLIPEPFMGDAYEVASATTATGGQAVLSAPSVTARGFSCQRCRRPASRHAACRVGTNCGRSVWPFNNTTISIPIFPLEAGGGVG